MASWLRRTQAGIQSAPTTPVANTAPTSATFVPANYSGGKQRDPNAPDVRLDVESRCIYERRLPGNAYITAHVTRLQDGFYDTPSTHGDCIDNVRFIAISFCFHPEETVNRFRSATISISLHDDTDQQFTDPSAGHKAQPFVPVHKPKFLMFAPHVLYGGVSPETLDWNFNLTGSLGVSQTPVSASLSPSGGVKSSYKIYQMMRIQGSKRIVRSSHYQPYDIEDGEIFWTLEENSLQRSGLPREFTFVLLATKGDVENVVFDIDIQPKIASWFGHYPKWWCHFLRYSPLQKESMDLDRELGQRFVPEIPGRGYNFANLASRFDSYVALPGTTTSSSDTAFVGQATGGPNQSAQSAGSPQKQQPQTATQSAPGGASAGQSSHVPSKPNHPGDPSQHPHKPGHSDKPVDYHIYLDNPRSISLHASSPAPSEQHEKHIEEHALQHNAHHYQHMQHLHALRPLKTDPQSMSQASSQENQLNPSSMPAQPQSQSDLAPPETRTPRRPTSNTKLKRRSIDISYMSTPQSFSSSSTQRHSSLRRSRSKSDLRAASSPVVEEAEDDDANFHSQLQTQARTQGQSGKEIDSSMRYAAHLPSQQQQRQRQSRLLQAQTDIPRRPRDRDSPSPPRLRRDISPYAELSKKTGMNSKRYSMPAYIYVNDVD